MLVEICGEYFNVDDIRHMYAKNSAVVVVELMNGDEYYLPYCEGNKGMKIEAYLKTVVLGIDTVSGRVR